jgi:NitT/TauT family transport system substrate-binding protein
MSRLLKAGVPMKTRLLSIAALVAGLALVSLHDARAQSPATAATIKGNGGKVRVLDNAFGTQAWPRYAIQKYQLDKKYGFELQIIPANTTQAQITAIQSGAADIGQYNWTDIARMRNAGVRIVGIAPTLRWADHIVTPVDSPIRTLADLKGKKFGVVSRTNLNWIVMRALAMREFKLDLEKDVQVHEGSATLLRGLLEQGQLDSIVMFNTLTPAAVAGGKFKVMAQIKVLIGQLGIPDVPFLMYAADTSYATANPQNVRAFLAAYREAVEIIRTNDAIWPEYGREVKMADDEALKALRDEVRADIMSRFEPITEAGIRKTFDILLATAGPEALGGMIRLPEGFMTTEYQPN